MVRLSEYMTSVSLQKRETIRVCIGGVSQLKKKLLTSITQQSVKGPFHRRDGEIDGVGGLYCAVKLP